MRYQSFHLKTTSPSLKELVSVQKWTGANWCSRKSGRDQGARKI